MEAIAEVNRHGGRIEKFVFISSVSAYGPETPGPIDEDHPLAAHTLPYAVDKMQADEVARNRSAQLGECATIILRPHIFAGATMQNYLIGRSRNSDGKGNALSACDNAAPGCRSFYLSATVILRIFSSSYTWTTLHA